MKETPILFNADMVRALLDGRKTQTRRLVKPQPPDGRKAWTWFATSEWDSRGISHQGCYVEDEAGFRFHAKSPFGAPGDRLWVRETWRTLTDDFGFGSVQYRADDAVHRLLTTDGDDGDPCGVSGRTSVAQWAPDDMPKWRPSIHMPRWACRLTLDVTAVRVERLQDISEEDARAEGASPIDTTGCDADERELLDLSLMEDDAPYRNGFATLWDSIYGKPSPVYARDGNGNLIITNYESYPWGGESGTFEHNGKPHIVVANPWVWVCEFEKQEATS